MTVKPEFFQYLDHFGKTVTLSEFATSQKQNLIALRHDVDYSIDVAMELGFWEYQQERKATFFLLDTADYWQDPRLIEKCLQLQDFGHEIGLHLNALSKWFRADIDDLTADIKTSLARLRNGGVRVVGVSAHGDKLCYQNHFINYWCFRELRPDNPYQRENGRSAEGLWVEDPAFRVPYPQDHVLQRSDGIKLELWTVSMADLDLQYDAMHVPMDSYYTDTGGSWSRSPDPNTADLTHGRHQVLMHPIYWRDRPKIYFFLSTARSGSLWLSQILDQASSAKGRHEFTLNHRYDGGEVRPEKRTFTDFRALMSDRAEATDLMREARTFIDDEEADWAEVNVYLGHLLPLFEGIFPDATLIHLHRHPKDVVRSLINRDWYDTPEDPFHPSMNVEGWPNLSQFEKACWYVRLLNEEIGKRAGHRLAFEPMVVDADYLTKALAGLGIAFYPRLVAAAFAQPVNLSQRQDFPPAEQWSDEHRVTFSRICSETCEALGYTLDRSHTLSVPAKERTSIREREISLKEIGWKWPFGVSPQGLTRRWKEREDIATKGCDIRGWLQPKIFLRQNEIAHVLLKGGRWHAIAPGEGWTVQPGSWLRGSAHLLTPAGCTATLFCLTYKGGSLLDRRALASFSASRSERSFAFRPRALGDQFNLVLYFQPQESDLAICLRHFQLVEIRPVHL